MHSVCLTLCHLQYSHTRAQIQLQMQHMKIHHLHRLISHLRNFATADLKIQLHWPQQLFYQLWNRFFVQLHHHPLVNYHHFQIKLISSFSFYLFLIEKRHLYHLLPNFESQSRMSAQHELSYILPYLKLIIYTSLFFKYIYNLIFTEI